MSPSRWIAVICLLAHCSASSAQQPAPAVAAAPQPKHYEVGDVHLDMSRVYAKVGKTGLGHEHGVVGRIAAGRIVLGAPEAAGELTFDMTSFVADTEPARKYVGLEGTTDASTQQAVNANMLGSKILDVANFPSATFVIASALRTPQPSERGMPRYELVGDFTFHGVTQPLKMVVEVESQNGWQHVRGGFYLKQTDFGVTPFTKALGAVGVADVVTVWGDAWLAETVGTAQ